MMQSKGDNKSLILGVISLVVSFARAELPLLQFDGPDPIGYIDIRIPQTFVPPQLTTYTCYTQLIPIPQDREYYAVAFDPIIDNSDVMHHMIMFGCDHSAGSSASLLPPHRCGSADTRCRSFLVQWSMGIKGPIRSPPHTGVKFGKGSYTHLALQIHWNNAKLANGTTDSSGIRVYYTSQPREFSLGNLQVGQNDLEIPPDSSHLAQVGSCSPQCTSHWLQQPIYLTRTHIHMHYLGSGGKLELVRGSKVTELVRDENYDYNQPPAHQFLNPIEVLPGDELRLTCYFNSRDGSQHRNRTVYWGEGSDGEMCYAFTTYYPKIDHFDQCIQFDKYDICSGTGFTSFGDCVFPGFVHAFQFGMSDEILKHCGNQEVPQSKPSDNENQTNQELRRGKSKRSSSSRICSEKCDIAVREVIEHPCMQGRLGHYARRVPLPQAANWVTVEPILDQWEKLCQD